jgi:DNA-binding IscR family transcriptional regulator
MRISAKAQNACIALLELARSYEDGQPVRIRTIAEAHGISPRFLVQILQQLKGAGFVISTRGASGGYRLVDGPLEMFLEPAALPASRVLREAWQEVAEAETRMLSAISLADLAERLDAQPQAMYFI